MNKSHLLNIVLSVLLIISVTVNVIVLIIGNTDTPPVIPSVESQTTVPTEPTTPKELMDVQTPFGVMQYPTMYKDYLVHEGVEDSDGYVHVFSYSDENNTIEMFRIHFASGDVPALLGTVTHNGETRNVGVSSTDFTPDDTWTAEEIDRFRSMMMAINDVLASVQAWSNFTK